MTVLPCAFSGEEFVVETDDFRTEHAYRKHVAMCKDLCKVCPIQADCLSDALQMDVLGVWGGTTRRERTAMRRELGMPKLYPAHIPESREEHVSAA